MISGSETWAVTATRPSGVFGRDKFLVFIFTAGSGGLPQSELTFASLVQDQGYDTALIGKWHLGLNCESRSDRCHHPNSHGFRYFFGIPLTNLLDCGPGHGTVFKIHKYIPVRSLLALAVAAALGAWGLGRGGGVCSRATVVAVAVALTVLVSVSMMVFLQLVPYMNCVLMRDGEIVEQPFSSVNLTQTMTREAVDFVQRSSSKPFLLMVSYIQVHTALFASSDFVGSSPHGLYGDAVQEVDWSVGQILATLERLNLSENTVVYLTSDQGAHPEEVSRSGDTHGGSNGIYRGGKSSNLEGGIRVPGLIRWTGKLPAGLEFHKPTSLMDVFPSVVKLTGARVPEDRVVDGRPLVDTLMGETEGHEFLFHYCNSELQAVRWSPKHSAEVWKAFYSSPKFYPEGSSICADTHYCFCDSGIRHDPPLLYELTSDPSESRPLDPRDHPTHQRVLQAMEQAVRDHRATVHPTQSEMSWGKTLPKPWLQPCCSTFTQLCSCDH